MPSLTSKSATGSGGGGGSGGIFADDEDNEDSSLFSASIGGGRYVLGRKLSGMVNLLMTLSMSVIYQMMMFMS